MKQATQHTSPVNIEERQKADIRPGDTVRVTQKIKEGEKSRLQVFEGVVIARKHGREGGATFTVRKVTSGVGTEKIFPLYSPIIEKLEVVKRAKTRRAKLYYIRDKAAREIRKKMRQMRFDGDAAISNMVTPSEEGEAINEVNSLEGGGTNENTPETNTEEVKKDSSAEESQDEDKKE